MTDPKSWNVQTNEVGGGIQIFNSEESTATSRRLLSHGPKVHAGWRNDLSRQWDPLIKELVVLFGESGARWTRTSRVAAKEDERDGEKPAGPFPFRRWILRYRLFNLVTCTPHTVRVYSGWGSRWEIRLNGNRKYGFRGRKSRRWSPVSCYASPVAALLKLVNLIFENHPRLIRDRSPYHLSFPRRLGIL